MSRVFSEQATEEDLDNRGKNDVSARPFVARVAVLPRDWDPQIEAAGGSLLQSWGWGEFKRASGWLPWRLALRERGVRDQGSGGSSSRSDGDPTVPLIYGQVLYRSVPRLPFRVSIGYVPRGPVYFSQDEGDNLVMTTFWSLVHSENKRRGAIFLKVEPNVALGEGLSKGVVDEKMKKLGFRPAGRLQPARTWVLDISGREDDLLKGMKPKTRYNLRLAGRRGVVVRRAHSLDDLQALYSLLETTGARDEFGVHTFSYYEQLWRTFGSDGSNSVVVLLAEHPDEGERARGPIAGLLAFRFGREAIYMYGASDNRGREHMPNYLLQWEAIKWARENGCSVYDFWGIPDAPGEGDEESGEVSPINSRSGLRGVYWFKRGFGGRELEYPGAYDYVYNPLLYKIWMRWRGSNLG